MAITHVLSVPVKWFSRRYVGVVGSIFGVRAQGVSLIQKSTQSPDNNNKPQGGGQTIPVGYLKALRDTFCRILVEDC